MNNTSAVLRLQPSLLEEARRAAAADDVELDQFVNIAVAEKLSALRTASYFQERAKRADVGAALSLLERVGANQEPLPGDELPDER